MILPFDSHNHVHMGPTPPSRALLGPSASVGDGSPLAVAGMALMSTHPREFDRVLQLSQELPAENPGVQIVPCFGVHPWYLHELADEDWETQPSASLPRWITELEEKLVATPQAIVGEIGLDAFHFDPNTKQLYSPMDKQLLAFRMQMELASRLQRPVSIHAVQCFGFLMDTLSHLKKSRHKLPPKIYFHAFGGKLGTVDQLLALCGREPGSTVYFGFAPIVNFRAPKTADIMRKVGLERLVLETDHEDAEKVPGSILECIRYISDALGIEQEDVIKTTTKNAYSLYGLTSSDNP